MAGEEDLRHRSMPNNIQTGLRVLAPKAVLANQNFLLTGGG